MCLILSAILISLYSPLEVAALPGFALQADVQTNNTLTSEYDYTKAMTGLNANSTQVAKAVTGSHPYITPNPVGQAGKVNITVNYSDNRVGIDSIRLDIHGPNIGSTDPQLAPATIGSMPMLLVSGTPQDGTWNANFTFPTNSSDGSYLYSLTLTDKTGHVTTTGPYSSIILDRSQSDRPETRIVYATDYLGRTLSNGSVTDSPNITFTFQGIDRTGVIQVFQCNLDDIIILSEHGHGDDPSQASSPYAPCFSPAQVTSTASGNYTYTNLGAGNHTFKVRAYDNEYDFDTSPSNFSWVIVQ
jgi:hypothetical protein